MRFTVYFESPFWVGVLEEDRDGVLYAARIVFGAEPNNQQIYRVVLHDLEQLRAQMIVGVATESHSRRGKNPKRVQREIRREIARAGTRSKAHEAMRQQIEQRKQTRRQQTKAERDAERERKRRIKIQKAKKKHRGR